MNRIGIDVGGTFTDIQNINPAISRPVTDQVYSTIENPHPNTGWYPDRIAVMNRLLTVDGEIFDKLLVVPGQFRANSPEPVTPTIGIQRLYSDLPLEVFHSFITATSDFVPPFIWGANMLAETNKFTVTVTARNDDDDPSMRVVML